MRSGKQTVGIVGLGIMGGAFARNLVASGFRVIGFDVDPARRRAARKARVEIAADAAALAAQAPVIITSLPNPAALAATVSAIAAAKLPRRIVVEASTFTLADKLAAEAALTRAGHVALDCPISGTGAQAKVKDLVIYASGDSRTIAKLRPVFLGFARAVHDVGAFGNGSRMKYVANLLVAIHNVASAEAMVLGIKSGLDPARIFELVKSGAGNSRVFELRAPMMVRDRLRQRHHDDQALAKGSRGDRRARSGARLPDAAHECDPADLCGGAVHGSRGPRHRRSLCGARGHGRREAQTGVASALALDQRNSRVAVSARTAAGSR